MTIVIDSREQRPYTFDNRETVVKRLPVGDYSIEGYETQITVERKSLDDFVNTVMNDWKRFDNELHRMRNFSHKAIVVETGIDAVLRGTDEPVSRAHPSAYMAKMFLIQNQFGVSVQFAGSRPAAVWFTEQFLWHAWKELVSENENT